MTEVLGSAGAVRNLHAGRAAAPGRAVTRAAAAVATALLVVILAVAAPPPARCVTSN